ncbi:MAG: TolC family protein [Desulfobacterales bacterium]
MKLDLMSDSCVRFVRPISILWACLTFSLILLNGHAEAVTLEECIREALRRNPDANAAAIRVEAARTMISEADSAYFPQLSVAGGYAVTDNPTQAFMMQLIQRNLDIRSPDFDPNEPGNTDNLRLSAELKYRVYDFGQRRMMSGSAALDADAVNLQLAAIRNELIYQITRGYFNILQARDYVTVQQETIDSLEESLQIAREKYKAGTAKKTDVLNLEVSLVQAREDLIRARNSVDLAIVALNTAIGYDFVTRESLPVPEENVSTPPVMEQDFKAIENRPELQAVERMSRIKERLYLKAKYQNFPVHDAHGSYDLDSGNLESFEGSYTVGSRAEWDIFTGFRNSSAARKAETEWRAAQQDAEQVRNTIKQDLQSARIQAAESWQRLETIRKSVESASESLHITQVRYREGVAGITDLLTAQVGLIAMRTRSVAAVYDHAAAVSNLQRARGELYTHYSSQ